MTTADFTFWLAATLAIDALFVLMFWRWNR
jgi:hypothetical protein